MKKIMIVVIYFVLSFLNVIANAESSFTIGVSAPLSGDLSEYGQAVRQGFTLATEEIKDSHINIQLTYEDNKFLPKDAITTYQKLSAVDNCDLMYLWGEVPTFAIQHLVDKAATPVLAMSVDGSPFHGQKNLHRIIADATEFMQPICAMLQSKNIHSINIVQTEDPFMLAMNRAISACPGLTVMSTDTVGPEEKDFKSYATKLHSKNPESIAILLNSSQAGTFARSLHQLGSTAMIIGTDVLDSSTEIALANGGLEGAVFPAISVPSDFEHRYVSRFGNNQQLPYAFNAYSTYRKIIEVIGQLDPKASGMEVAQKMEDVTPSGLSGRKGFKASLIPTTIELKLVQGAQSHWMQPR